MELLQLQYFSEVARQHSITKAAQLLHVSQPSLSQTLRRLENELGVKLIEKSGRGIRLTAKGRRFYTQISFALNGIQYATEDIRGDTLQGNITLGSYLPLAPLLPSIQEFSQENPDVTFTFLSITDTHMLQIEQMDGILSYAQSNTMGFRERRLVATYDRQQIVPAGHEPPTQGQCYTLGDVEKDAFASLILPGNQVEEIFTEFSRVGIVPNIRYRTNSSMIKQEILEAGLATGFSNHLLTDLFHPTGNYRICSYPPSSYRQHVILNWRSDEVLSIAAQKFKTFCCERFPEYEI